MLGCSQEIALCGVSLPRSRRGGAERTALIQWPRADITTLNCLRTVPYGCGLYLEPAKKLAKKCCRMNTYAKASANLHEMNTYRVIGPKGLKAGLCP